LVDSLIAKPISFPGEVLDLDDPDSMYFLYICMKQKELVRFSDKRTAERFTHVRIVCIAQVEKKKEALGKEKKRKKKKGGKKK
jgi:hypothetical protein